MAQRRQFLLTLPLGCGLAAFLGKPLLLRCKAVPVLLGLALGFSKLLFLCFQTSALGFKFLGFLGRLLLPGLNQPLNQTSYGFSQFLRLAALAVFLLNSLLI